MVRRGYAKREGSANLRELQNNFSLPTSPFSFAGSLSYKQHGYRLLCIWFHGVDRNETPVRQLYEALVAIGRKQLADRMRLSLDAGLSKSGNGKCAVS